MSVVQKNAAAIIQAAHDLNFWGKKLLDKKRICAGKIADQFTGGQHVGEIMDLLEANRPVKATKAKEEKAPIEPTFSSTAHHYDNAERLVLDDRPVIVYAVQNNALPCLPVLATINRVAEELDAITMPCRVGYIVDKDQDCLYHVASNVQCAPIWIGDHLLMAGEVSPTAKKPINHAKLVSNGRPLTILPHVKQQAESLPKAKGSPEVWAVTTGAATLPRYRQGRAGAEAHADHCLGFTIVYPSGLFQQVQLNELGVGYLPGVRTSPEGLTDQAGGVAVLGDIHSEKIDHAFLDVTYDWLQTVQPTAVVIHDLHDFTSRNHHNRQSGVFLAGQGDRTVADDLLDAISVLEAIQDASPDSMIYIVNSNHDRALDTWLDDPSVDPRKDPKNLPLWCDLQKARFLAAMGGESLGITLETALISIDETAIEWSRIEFLREDQSLLIHGVEFGQHGDRGINGARGGYTAFERLGSSYVIGHTHSGYKNGRRVAVAGVTGRMDMGYNKGASSWSQSHIFVGCDGVPQIVMGL